MKILHTSILDFSDACIVSEDQIQHRLLRIDLDTYAVSVPWQDEAVLAFRSRAFSALLNWMDSPIVDFAAFKVDCLEDSHEDSCFFELRILGKSGKAFKFDSRGCVEEFIALEEVQGQPEGAFSPAEKWEIEPDYPHDRIMMSDGLGKSWAEYFENGSPKELIEHLWLEFAREREASGPRPVHNLTSEFGPLCAVESVCGRIVFVTTIEGMFVGSIAAENEDNQKPE